MERDHRQHSAGRPADVASIRVPVGGKWGNGGAGWTGSGVCRGRGLSDVEEMVVLTLSCSLVRPSLTSS